jgi:hypothetical protein
VEQGVKLGIGLGCVALVAAGAAVAGTLTADVLVTVQLVSSSGACGAVATEPAVQVTCQRPAGQLLPDAGTVIHQRAGTIRAPGVGVGSQPLPIYSDGTKVTSWRMVQLDNARYVELTIAW